jgi:hypothetical protein
MNMARFEIPSAMTPEERADDIYMLSFKGFTTDYLSTLTNLELEQLVVEYIVLAEDYV